MGWYFNTMITRKELVAELTKPWGNEKGSRKCLAHCFRGNAFSGTLWSVWEVTYTDSSVPSQRWIQCDLLQYRRDDGWGYKPMDEAMYPYYFSCPLGYLNMVPIDEYGGNEDWREGVFSYHARAKERRVSKV